MGKRFWKRTFNPANINTVSYRYQTYAGDLIALIVPKKVYDLPE
jgi:hypothetical protein